MTTTCGRCKKKRIAIYVATCVTKHIECRKPFLNVGTELVVWLCEDCVEIVEKCMLGIDESEN